MASLIPGLEYDIFISYRQKDNKGDKWVSEFFEALKTELESTFIEYLLSIPGELSVQLLKVDPVYDRLRNLPRFQKILEAEYK